MPNVCCKEGAGASGVVAVWQALRVVRVMHGGLSEGLECCAAHVPVVLVLGVFGCAEAAELGYEGEDPDWLEGCAGVDVSVEPGCEAGPLEELELVVEQLWVEVVSGGQLLEAVEQCVEEFGVWVLVADEQLCDLAGVESGVVEVEVCVQGGEGLGQVPLGDQGEFAGGLDEERGVCAGEQLDAA